MDIQIKLYGDLVKYAPGKENVFIMTLPPPVTIASVLADLNLSAEQAFTVLLNGRREDPSMNIKPGSTLVLMPEISGG